MRLGDTTVVDKAASSPQAAAVHLHIREIPEACDCICRDEAYELVITAEGISIAAEHPAGVFYGIQSLLQLLPWSLDVSDSYPTLRGCRILDYPRFRWYVNQHSAAGHPQARVHKPLHFYLNGV